MISEIANSKKPSRSSVPVDRPDLPNSERRRRSHSRWETRKLRPDYTLVSAGGVVYRNRGGRIEVFFIKDPFGRWSFPKGKVQIGETLAETAVREIREETGLGDLRLIASLGKTSFRFWREAGLIEKTVHLFLFRAPAGAKARVARAEAIQGGAWMPVHCAFQVSGYRNSDKLLGEAMRKIAEAEGVQMPLPSARRDPKKRRGRMPRRGVSRKTGVSAGDSSAEPLAKVA